MIDRLLSILNLLVGLAAVVLLGFSLHRQAEHADAMNARLRAIEAAETARNIEAVQKQIDTMQAITDKARARK